MSQNTIQQGDFVSVQIAGKVFVLPVAGFHDGNRALIYLETPTGFLVLVAIHQIKAVNFKDGNVIRLTKQGDPPLCISSARSGYSEVS